MSQPANETVAAPPRAVLLWKRAGILAAAAVVLSALAWHWYAPYRWRRQADAAHRAGDDQAAAQLLTNVVNRLPQDGASRLKLAQLLDEAGDVDGAVAQLRLLPGAERDREEVLTNLGRLLIATYRPTEAEDYLVLCVRRYPGAVRARQLLLDIYRWQHRTEEGILLREDLWQVARQLSVADRLWILIRSFLEDYTKVEDQEAWDHLLRCWNRDKNDPVVRIAMARHLILVGDQVDSAAKDLEALLPFRPDSLAGIAALLHFDLVLIGRAPERTGALLDRWPTSLRVHTYWAYRGRCLEQRGEHEPAVAAYRNALAQRPDDLLALSRLSPLLFRLAKAAGDTGRIEEAKVLGDRLRTVQRLRSGAIALSTRLSQWLAEWDRASRGNSPRPDPALLIELADFYHGMERTEESRRWRSVHGELIGMY
jgi:tetratricopeptide (TPR) repeat protein